MRKVTVRCKCQTLKKEWICQDVQAAYCDTGYDPKDISKNQFGLGLLPCNSDCKSKIQEVDSALQLLKPKVLEVRSFKIELALFNSCFIVHLLEPVFLEYFEPSLDIV